ncbi:MAG: DUF1549 domain-containing protein, partial [Candidatus Saccharimonas sp.]|nr:DUF1549 domain-containing protein [Planctomycetaceae bacterium]
MRFVNVERPLTRLSPVGKSCSRESLPRPVAQGCRDPLKLAAPGPSRCCRLGSNSPPTCLRPGRRQPVQKTGWDDMLPRSMTKTVFPLLVIAGVFALVATAARSHVAKQAPEIPSRVSTEPDAAVSKIDRLLADKWRDAELQPARAADEFSILRRLSLVLHGTIPSLEEIRLFEADTQPQRIERWTERLLADRRFADYFTRRLARVYVGADEGQFVVFRRDRFWAWLGQQLHDNRPYDAVVRSMIAERGLWTGEPEVNFVTATVNDGDIDYNKLAGRTVRAFLGQRIDCAQCHNHPFADWKQGQFEGLAACYGQTRISPVGVEDDARKKYSVEDLKLLTEEDLKKLSDEEQRGKAQREVSPGVPFHPEWLPNEGTQRERLAAWVTHADNRRFDRAIVNRVWGLMFGKPWIEPVDDLPNPQEPERDPTDLLDVLGADFREHGCDMKRLIATIAATRAFRLSSEHPAFETGEKVEAIEQTWAAFPLTRLRPEQVIGAMLQASTIKTIDQNSHWVQRALRFFSELNFVKEYGDLGDDELGEHSGTIPQALLRMNGEFARDRSQGTPFSAAGRIADMAPDDDTCLDLCFLVCL